MKKVLSISFFSILFCLAYAQDLIYSQFNAMPLELNPAFAGNNSCNYRMSVLGRSQWLGINNVNSYKSVSIAGDVNLNNNYDDRINLWGIGGMISYDKSSVASFSGLTATANLAYHLRFGKSSNHFLSLGIQAGAGSRSMNPGTLLFDDQIDGYGRIALPRSGDIVTRDQFWYPEFGFGSILTLNPTEELNLYFGSSIYHLLSPNLSFTNEEYKLPVRFNFHGGGNILYRGFIFIPSVYIQRQQIWNYNFGTYAGMMLFPGSETKDPTIGYLGLWVKSNDAIAAALRMDIGKLSIAFSYDIHTGGVARNLNSIGSPELSLNYYGCFRRNTRRMGCPML